MSYLQDKTQGPVGAELQRQLHAQLVMQLIVAIGDDPKRDGLRETPERVVRSWEELFAGYKTDPATILKEFDGGGYNEMVMVRGIEFYSICEHHMLPFIGVAHVAYIPGAGGRIVGLSKLARLVDCFARRLQTQENITRQVTDTLVKSLLPLGAGCVLEARHLCMSCRGVGKQGSDAVTSRLWGSFYEPEVRTEFFNLIRR